MATTRDNQHEARRADSAQRRFQFGLVWFRRVGGLVMPPFWGAPQKKVGQRMLSIILSPYPALPTSLPLSFPVVCSLVGESLWRLLRVLSICVGDADAYDAADPT